MKRAEWAKAGTGLFAARLVVLLAVLSVVTTLASRTFRLYDTSVSTVRPHSTVKIQHRDNDAYRWSAPVASFVLLPASAPFSKVSRRDKPRLSLRLDDCCFNRPPPAS